MYRKAIWIFFILVIASVAIWFIAKAGYDLYEYYQLKARREVVVNQWEVHENKSDEFVIIAHYTYEYQGKNFFSKDRVGGIYPNPWAAEGAKTRFSKQIWSVWIDPNHPGKNTLEKHFPIKRILSATVLIGLALYFFILAGYMRFKTDK